MAGSEQRDFFISFNSADLAYAEAIDAALQAAGFTTFFHPSDLPAGGTIPAWMDDGLMNSNQTLALFSPDYTKPEAIYSRAEREATWWQAPRDDKRKLIPILLRDTTFTPLMAPLKRIDVRGMTREEAGAHVVTQLKTPKETEQRNLWRVGLPLPKIFNAAYRPNPNFTGRFEALDSLQNSLRHGTNAAITAVAGMGGIGKTTLAAEYCHRFGGRYAGVWWVRAEQESVMLADLEALGQRLGIVSGQNVETDARACLDHLANAAEPWLVVYDNAPNPDAVRKWLPTGAVRCIITSRYAGFGDIANVTRLDQWADEVTATYLLSRTGRTDRAGAERLARALDGLPVAAEQAATYLEPRVGILFDEYAADIGRLIKRPKPKGAKGEYPDTVYAAFVKSLETLHEIEGGETSLDLLRLCSFLSPDGVDLALLTAEGGETVLPTAFATAMVDKEVREDALAALRSLSLLRRQNEDSVASDLAFHRLLPEVVRDWMSEDARAVWARAAVYLITGAFPRDIVKAPSNWPICDSLMPHVLTLETHIPHLSEVTKALTALMIRACLYLLARGNRSGALVLGERAVATARLINREEPLWLMATLNNLAATYFQLNQFEDAEEIHSEVLGLAEAHLPHNDPRLATCISNLASVYSKQRDFTKAEPLYMRAAEITRLIYGDKSGEYGADLSNLGALYCEWADEPGQTARRQQEENYKAQALRVIRAARGERHPDTAIQHNNISAMKARKGDWAGAASDMERGVAIMLSLDLARHGDMPYYFDKLIRAWKESNQNDKTARLQHGDISDLLPVIAEIEAEHRAWVAKDPENRHFGPPPPARYEAPRLSSELDASQIVATLTAAGIDIDDLVRRVRSGELSNEEASRIMIEKLANHGG